MKNVFVLIGFLCVMTSLPVGAAEVPDRGIGLSERETEKVAIGNFWALLIGIDDYDHWPKLSTAVKDTLAVQEVLEGRYRFSPRRIKRLANKEATRQGIIDAFEWLINEVDKNDNLLIYYAGHGEMDKVTGYWVPSEARTDKKGAYVSNSTIRDYIGVIEARHIYLVADSCFSGSLFSGVTRSKPQEITGRYYQEVYHRISRQGLTSGGMEPVRDEGYEGHSIFSYYFLKALRENKDPYLTATSLFDRIAVPVANNSRQTPVSRAIKDVRDEGGEFLFALASETVSDPKAITPEVMEMPRPDVLPGVLPGVPEDHSEMGAPEIPPKHIKIIGSPDRLNPRRTIVLLSGKNQDRPEMKAVVGRVLMEKLEPYGVRVMSDTLLGKKEMGHLRQAVRQGKGIDRIRDNTDTLLWVSLDVRPSHVRLEGLVSCVADAGVEAISVETGKVVAHRTFQNIRGFSANRRRACFVALTNMGREIGATIIERLDHR